MCSKYFSKLICLILTLPLYSLACPYCAGQSGENYIEAIIVPIAGLLLTPFIILGTIGGIIFFHQKNNK
ncbi:MAG: hypothetical protein QF856_05690 [Candidatus Marinimicrobia bacterium]|jgi:hypothetical protein|nr:hypothetical protein [Candidatus Neomarinimicrobiota bacterium]|tara:strand:+ start:183 stop:389 length:207 start_codon:yes stop_codon:yes gene_type:complete